MTSDEFDKAVINGAMMNIKEFFAKGSPLGNKPDPDLEPVAWITTWNEPQFAGVELHWEKKYKGPSCKYTPLYKIPPNKEWVGLTDDEKSDIYNMNYNLYAEDMHIGDFFLIQQAVEAKLKEKNT